MTSQPNLSIKTTSRPTILYDLVRVRETHIQTTAKEASAPRRTQLLRGTHTLSPPPSGTFPEVARNQNNNGRERSLFSRSSKDTQRMVDSFRRLPHHQLVFRTINIMSTTPQLPARALRSLP
ncbi:hypothetical protein GCK72_015551 [Caenorhabditis remanei]|uniref:Uncharacterized protein n=1 Tax=Caenorhabditis remanei TaxID=31234 RepID=A0A6A5GUD5_CAERE|nr:hypothetical protein GCK72_015551 [Caenorhabditis remanei]KAF1759090.1 hypothetical protein GCK72_015551 [Caenorhabditis remanei]